MKNEEQSNNKKELINKKLLIKLWWLRENERRDFMIDEMNKTKKLKRKFLDVCELSKVRREMLAFEKKSDLLILLIYIFRVMINWHHSLIRWHHSSNTLTSLFEYIDITLRIHWHPLVRSGKKVARSSAILHARCTRSAQITWFQKKLRSLLS